jgi:8-oxo-dGTP diphosphatase
MRREYPDAPIVGVGAVIVDGDKVLLIRRGNPPLQEEWSLPGGALELGETLEQGIVREVKEETGLEVKPLSVVEVFDRIHREAERVRYHFVLVDFLCRVEGGSLCCATDADDARWIHRQELGSHSIWKVEPFTVAVIEKAFRMSKELQG